MKTQLHLRSTSCRADFVLICVLPLAFLATALSLCLFAFPTAAADKHPFGVDDYSALHTARALAVSPDGKSVLYVVSYDGDKGPTKHEWHLIDVTGSNDRKLDLPESFQPDGFTKDGQALYGAYQVNKKPQLAIVSLQGKATQIISLPRGIRGNWISPDGNRFVLTADPHSPDPLDEVRHVAENEVNSLYVSDLNGSPGAWWCPELKDVTDVACPRIAANWQSSPNTRRSAITTCARSYGSAAPAGTAKLPIFPTPFPALPGPMAEKI